MSKPTISQAISEMELEIFKALEAKTSWGRNDLKLVIKDCSRKVLSSIMDMIEADGEAGR